MGVEGFKMLGTMCLLVCVSNVFGQGGPPPGGPPPGEQPEDPKFTCFIVTPMTTCTDVKSLGFMDTSNVNCKILNETTSIITGTVNLTSRFEPDVMLELVMEKEGPGGKLEKVFVLEICNVCNEFGNEEGDYYQFIKYFGMPEQCPFEPGMFSINDMMVEMPDELMNSSNRGCYVNTMNYKRSPDGSCKDEMEFLGCVTLEFCIEEI